MTYISTFYSLLYRRTCRETKTAGESKPAPPQAVMGPGSSVWQTKRISTMGSS